MKLLVPFALAACSLTSAASAQLRITETIDVNAGFLSLYRPGRIVERIYTGSWTIDWSVSGRLHGGDPTVSHTLDITGVVGSGGPDFLGGVAPSGPITTRSLFESFPNLQVGDSVSRTGSLQGSVVNFPGDPVVGGLPSQESWHIVTAHMDYNTYLDGSVDFNHSFGRFHSTGNFDGSLTLTYDVDPHPSTPVCAGGAEFSSYGADGRLYFLHTADLPPSATVILVEGQPAPAMSSGICLGSPLRRVPGSLQVASVSGSYTFEVDRTQYMMGTTSAFQLWYSTPMATGFSDAIEVQIH